MYDIFLILLIPIVISFIGPLFFGWKKFNPLEVVISLVVTCSLIAITYGLMISSFTSDVQILNGQVTGKEKKKVGCSHSYDCRCHYVTRGTGKNKRRVRECDTCYEHSHDFNWNVYANIGSDQISRVDRQGAVEPVRFTQIKPGDPFSLESSWTNYLLASEKTILLKSDVEASKKFLPMIPRYPTVFDYYKVNHVLTVGSNVPDLAQWNEDIGKVLGTLGPSKKANIIVIITNQSDQRGFMNALWTKWVGGKNNDIVVVIAADNAGKIAWTQIMTWSKTNALKVKLRDGIQEVGVLDRTKLVPVIAKEVTENFIKVSKKQNMYLSEDIHLSERNFIIIVVLSIVLSLGLMWFFWKNDIRF